MRLAGRERLGFYPLAVAEAKRIRGFLRFPSGSCAAVDPCIGEGVAFQIVTAEADTRRYGIELDAYRAEQACSVVDELIHGNCFDVQCPVESFSLDRCQRAERHLRTLRGGEQSTLPIDSSQHFMEERPARARYSTHAEVGSGFPVVDGFCGRPVQPRRPDP